MNKLLIILLAVCLVNVYALEKRDAPDTNFIEAGKKGLEQFSDNVKSFVESNLNADKLKKGFNDFVDGVNTMIHPKNAPPQ